MHAEPFFDPNTATFTYVVHNKETQDAIIIDPLLNYDPQSKKTSTDSADRLIAYCGENSLKLQILLETHVHADHLSAANYLKKHFQVSVGIHENVKLIQHTFKELWQLDTLKTDGSQFDKLLKHGEPIKAGSINIRVWHTPGHTPACVAYEIGDALFVGDALFMPHLGTGRCDFPGGSAELLFKSINEQIYTKPDSMRIFVGHDYPAKGLKASCQSSVGEEKAKNCRLNKNTQLADFIAFRQQRDAELPEPKLMRAALPFNLNGAYF